MIVEALFSSIINDPSSTHFQNEKKTLYCLCLICATTFLFLSSAPPSVSEISKPSIIYAQVQTDLRCTIRGAGQRELRVRWSKLSAGSEELSEGGSLLGGGDLSDQACLLSDCEHHTSVLTVCLTVSEDRTQYQCEVLCRGQSITRVTTVRVKGEEVERSVTAATREQCYHIL